MKPGKISQTVYRRSVLKQLNTDVHAAFFPPAKEECCYGIKADPGEMILSSGVSLYGNEKDLCVFAIAQVCNALATRGASPKGVSIQIMLPEFAYESRLKAMMQTSSEAAKEYGIEILAADVQNVPGIQTTIVNVTAVGTTKRILQSCKAPAGQDIVQIKWIGLEGTLRILKARQESLAKHFPSAFLKQTASYEKELISLKEMKAADAIGVSAMHQIGDGGILAALWELAEGADIGLSVDMRRIPVKQETIEVCEYFHLNPYQLTSTGSILVITPKGEELADTLTREGMAAAVIGHTTAGRERIILNQGEIRYIDRPALDELTKILI